MDDPEIIELIFNKDESGIKMLSDKYSKLIAQVCRGMLRSHEDAEETANDTLMAVWNAIPPERPVNLTGFVCNIARRLAVSRIRYNTAAMRNADLISELDECLTASGNSLNSVEERAEAAELSDFINEWLGTLSVQKRRLFILRYYYMKTVKESARDCGMTKTAATTALMRLREALKVYLNERGTFI